MITEDYVSYEIAKLLKEKGFDWECISYYIDDEPNDIKYSFLGETNSTWESRCCSAPTLQMVLKWLREVHNIFIIIDYVILSKSFYEYKYEIHNMRKGRSIAVSTFRDDYETYEEACEAAIKYCLTNLI